MKFIAWVNGREIREIEGGYGIFEGELLISSTLATKERALREAISLPSQKK